MYIKFNLICIHQIQYTNVAMKYNLEIFKIESLPCH